MNSSGKISFEDRQELFWLLVEDGPFTLTQLAVKCDVPIDRVRKIRNYLEEVGDIRITAKDDETTRRKYGKLVTTVGDSGPVCERRPVNPFSEE